MQGDANDTPGQRQPEAPSRRNGEELDRAGKAAERGDSMNRVCKQTEH